MLLGRQRRCFRAASALNNGSYMGPLSRSVCWLAERTQICESYLNPALWTIRLSSTHQRRAKSTLPKPLQPVMAKSYDPVSNLFDQIITLICVILTRNKWREQAGTNGMTSKVMISTYLTALTCKQQDISLLITVENLVRDIIVKQRMDGKMVSSPSSFRHPMSQAAFT